MTVCMQSDERSFLCLCPVPVFLFVLAPSNTHTRTHTVQDTEDSIKINLYEIVQIEKLKLHLQFQIK